MSNTITFEDAKQAGIILPDHYLAITVPKDRQVTITKKETGVKGTQKFMAKEGERQLWRVTEDFRLLGKPTKEGLTLCGEVGFDQGPDTMHQIIRELHDNPDSFEEAKACSWLKKDYFFSSIEKAYQEGKKYRHPDDRWMKYWLASRCVVIGYSGVYFRVFVVYGGNVGNNWLYYSNGDTNYDTREIRPEATPKSTLLLERNGCDGSKEKPWKCLSK